jgi:hypothetical protein
MVNGLQRPGLWEGWEIEFLLPGLGRIFCINTANVPKFNRITKAEGLFPNPTLPKPLLAAECLIPELVVRYFYTYLISFTVVTIVV